jgi:hypothetical protein
LLRYRHGRYLWWALALCVLSAVLYSTGTGLQRRSGGTWQGYVLGTVGALLIVWLAYFGIRKRSYSSSLGSLQGWASAHVYLGTSLIVVATLHCAGNFGWNVHTLAYALMLIVISTGLIGVYLYLNVPRAIEENRVGAGRAALFAELYALDAQAREFARHCQASTALAVKSSIERTVLGGGLLQQLSGSDRSWMLTAGENEATESARLVPNIDQRAIVELVSACIPRAQKVAESSALQSLVTLLCRRQMILRRIRRDIRLHGWLRLWLYIHVPLSIALLAALTAHILATFIYW